MDRNNTAQDPVEKTTPPFGFESHGTSIVSTVVSPEGHWDKKKEPFVSGVSPLSKVIPFRVTRNVILSGGMLWAGNFLSIGGKANGTALAKAINYCILVDKLHARKTEIKDEEVKRHLFPVHVISISLGREPKQFYAPDRLRKAVRAARERGIIVFAAAGQGLPKFLQVPPGIPGAYADSICVAACDYQGKRLSNGFYGPEVDITAPGINIWRALTQKNKKAYTYTVGQSSGSSYATAITAGACALWQAHHTREYLIEKYSRSYIFYAFLYCLQNSCDKNILGWKNDSVGRGRGVLDAEKLLKTQLPTKVQVSQLAGIRSLSFGQQRTNIP